MIASLCAAAAAAQPSGQPDPTTFFDQPAPISNPEQISEYVREVFQDRDGVFWFGTNGEGVARFDGESLTYLSVEQGLAGRAIRGILQDPGGALWFATSVGVSRYESGKFTNYTVADGLSDNSVWSIMLDSAGTIWVGTGAGVCRLDGKSFVPFPLPRVEVEYPASPLTPQVVFGMFEDRAGNLWFGTYGEGAHRYDGESFTSYTQKDGLASNFVRCIVGDRHGQIWIGTNGGGVSRYNGKAFQNFTRKDGLTNNRVYEILEDKAGNLWFSTLGGGACRYDGTSFTAFREDHDLILYGSPARAHVQEFFEDKDGILWLGCSGGLFRFDGESFINVTRDGPWPVRNGSVPAKAMGGKAAVHEPAPVSLEAWPSETFALPPGFAPELPTGTESLRFAPGWRDPNAEDFWSYAFVMRIDESVPDAARIDELLENYYDGLMTVFAANKDEDVGSDPAQVEVVQIGANRYEATMHVIDAFATFKPMDIRIKIETVVGTDERSALRIQLSPQPDEHEIWRSLEAAIADIESRDD